MQSGAEPVILRFDAGGLIPVIAQDEATSDVVLLAYMNEQALHATLAEGILVLWSRSRGRLWRKGELSGHRLILCELRVNCEGNSLLARVRLDGPGACHDGYRTCYYRALAAAEDGALTADIIATRTFDPAAVYAPPPSFLPPDVGARRLPAGPAIGSPGRPRAVGEGAEVGASAGHAPLRHGPPALEPVARALYAAYERLRDVDLTATSNTSRLLRAPDPHATATHALARARDELGELRGVLDGTHRHTGDGRDVILEAGQVEYWVMVAAVALRQPYNAWCPHEAWLAGGRNLQAPDTPAGGVLRECAEALRAAGQLCRAAGADPMHVVSADLDAMNAKHAERA
jgi:phosphoribosyl-AMP cyclohydrolase